MERLQDGSVIKIAAGYIRESTKLQEQGYAPDIQRQGIMDCAKQNGFVIPQERLRTDYERGSKVSRKGYQEIVEWVRQGEVSAVFVYAFDRFGRNASEWLGRYDEFQKYKAGLYSVKEGKAHGFLVPAIHAAMAQEYSVNLAAKVRPAKIRAAMDGKHIGPTPLGYIRVYPERRGERMVRSQAGLLTPDPDTAPFIQELFSRYATGRWQLKDLASWANSDPAHPKPRDGKYWHRHGIKYMLQNPVYIGKVRYNHKQTGYYERADPGSVFVADGLHEPLVSVETWETVQALLNGNVRAVRTTRTGLPAPLAGGLLVCGVCGGPMTPVNRLSRASAPAYSCLWKQRGRVQCNGSSYIMDLAHDALLREVGRLVPQRPLSPLMLEPVEAETESLRAQVMRELDKAKASRLRLAERLAEEEDTGMIDAIRLKSGEITRRVRVLEEQLQNLPASTTTAALMEQLTEKYSTHSVADIIATARRLGGEQQLRALCLELVESARVDARWPEHRSRWLHMAVTWTPGVQRLLSTGAWGLAPAEPPPHITR